MKIKYFMYICWYLLCLSFISITNVERLSALGVGG